jgi:pantoate--beta-alanine ligase
MMILSEIPVLQETVAQWRIQRDRIAFVPTMGNLHEGHLQLVKTAKTLAAKVIVSVFVNSMQFDRASDLKNYPRTLEVDKARLEDLKVNLLFTPTHSEIYPNSTQEITHVDVPGLSTILCGASRPGHFRGVATVVAKLFNIVQPDVAVFGEKDFQQLMLIRRMVADLNIPVEIVGVMTVREPDGLAMSSRNSYLSVAERSKAPLFYKTLKALVYTIKQGERDYPKILDKAKQKLKKQGFIPDYLSILRQQDLTLAQAEDVDIVVLGATWLGNARLIDNITLCLKDRH